MIAVGCYGAGRRDQHCAIHLPADPQSGIPFLTLQAIAAASLAALR